MICVKDTIQLHGSPGNAEVIGISECNKIVKEFEKLKTQGTAKKDESTEADQEKLDETPEKNKNEESDGDDDLAIEMPGGSPDITFHMNKHTNTAQEDIHTPHFKAL